MAEVCSFCGNAEFKKKHVEYIYRREGKMLVVSGVPCTECTYCGERYYAADVLARIEADFNDIADGTRSAKGHLTVPVEDYSQLA